MASIQFIFCIRLQFAKFVHKNHCFSFMGPFVLHKLCKPSAGNLAGGVG